MHVSRPPLFSGENFDYWKDKIKTFFESNQFELWDMVEEGYTQPTTPKNQWTDPQKKSYQTHQKARHYLICALSREEYEKCGRCETAKEIWDSLVLSYEGSDQVRET